MRLAGRKILLAAASDRQAGGLFDAASRFVRRAPPACPERLRVRDHEGTIICQDGLGSFLRLTSNGRRLGGVFGRRGIEPAAWGRVARPVTVPLVAGERIVVAFDGGRDRRDSGRRWSPARSSRHARHVDPVEQTTTILTMTR